VDRDVVAVDALILGGESLYVADVAVSYRAQRTPSHRNSRNVRSWHPGCQICRPGHHHRQGHRAPLHARHRAIEFKKFLQTLDREVPDDLDVHVVLDNSSTHKTPSIQSWLTTHPRFVVHSTPTSSSWLNVVEHWFAEQTTKKLKRGAHRSVRALNADIRAWIETWNDNPRPFVWTKTPTRSSNRSPATPNESTNHDTRPASSADAVAAAARRRSATASNRRRGAAVNVGNVPRRSGSHASRRQLKADHPSAAFTRSSGS
jgi:transposase